jgi:hypothetical protein
VDGLEKGKRTDARLVQGDVDALLNGFHVLGKVEIAIQVHDDVF